MASSFSWMDYSEHERQKVLEVIDLFGEHDVRDELGIGTVRDALADRLFPGTSTIQTRARYFLFIPWHYRALEAARIPPVRFEERLRAEETALIQALKAAGERSGVIGIDRGAQLRRRASSVYWQGLGRWGIRRFPGSQAQFTRAQAAPSADPRGVRGLRNDEGDPVEGAAAPSWNPALPPPPDGFPRAADLRLRREEAEFLRERLLRECGGSLLAHLVDRCPPFGEVDFAWQHPQAPRLPPALRAPLEHARRFSEAMHGAALLYNLLLAEARADAKLCNDYHRRLAGWGQARDRQAEELQNWDPACFWSLVTDSGARIHVGSRRFITSWLDLLRAALASGAGAAGLVENRAARELIGERERRLKGTRARLANPRALELWTGAAGAAQLDYRWFRVQRIVLDILEPLHAEAADA